MILAVFLRNFCDFGWFLAQNEKYPKQKLFLKVKIENNTIVFITQQLISNIKYAIPIV